MEGSILSPQLLVDKREKHESISTVQALLQTFYFTFLGVFGTPQLFRCLDRRANKRKTVKPKNYWLNRYFPQGSFPVRMDMVHLEADRMNNLEKARFKLHLPVDVATELEFQASPLASFAKISLNDRSATFEVLGPIMLNKLYFSIIDWTNGQLKTSHLKGDSEHTAQLVYYFFGLDKAPVPQPVPRPVGNKTLKIQYVEKTRRGRKSTLGIRLLP